MSKCIICFEYVDDHMLFKWCICRVTDNQCGFVICDVCSKKYTFCSSFICSEQAIIKYMTYYSKQWYECWVHHQWYKDWMNDQWFTYSNRNIFREDQQKRMDNAKQRNKKNATKCLNKYFYSDLVDVVVSFVI